MKWIGKLNNALGFTPSEQKVVLVLIGAFVAGWGVRWVRQAVFPRPAYDYHRLDSEFTARSMALHPRGADSSAVGDTLRRPAKIGVSGRTRVNINTASKAELVRLPGIGEAMAERIIGDRTDHGPFPTVDALGRVKGIGKQKLRKLVPLCTTGK